MTTRTDDVTWTHGRVDVDGVGLHFRRAGTVGAPALVLAHGLSDSGRCWERTVAVLQDDFDVVALDARNHGRSDTATTSPGLLANDVAQAITELQLHRPTLMGHSIGAHTVALTAARFPALVSRLVLEDPPWTIDRAHDAMPVAAATQRRDEIASWLGSFADLSRDEIAEAGRRDHPTWPESAYSAWIESNQQVRVEAADGLDFGGWASVVSDLACRTLLVWGDVTKDGLVTPRVAEQVAEMNPLVRHEAIAGAGHNIRRENFDQFMQVVTDFLADEHSASTN